VRHLMSLVVALVLGAATYILLGIFLDKTGAPGSGWSLDTVIGLICGAGAGLAYALMVLPRMSPLGPFLVGVVFAGAYGWLHADPSSFAGTIPDVILDSSRVGAVPLLAIFALPLLATVFMVDRWRRYTPMAALAPLPQQSAPPVSAPPQDYGTVDYGQPQYPPLGTPYSGPPAYQPDPPPWGGPPSADSETTRRL
jgi:hypothetical protein